MLRLVLIVATAVVVASRIVSPEADVPVHNPLTSSWRLLSRAHADDVLDLSVHLAVDEGRRAALEAVFWSVSDPQNKPEYGRHRTIEQIRDLLAVPLDRVERVRNWLLTEGAVEATVSPYNDVVRVRISCADVERVLATRLGAYVHVYHRDEQIIRASTHYSLPAAMAADVEFIGELLQFPYLREETSGRPGAGGDWPNACTAKSCDGMVTPAVLAARYSLPNATTTTTTTTSSSLSVAEFGRYQSFWPAALTAFGDACHANVSVDHLIGTNDPSPRKAGLEAQLDIEYAKAVSGPGVPLTVIYGPKYSLLRWIDTVLALAEPPLVHSVSYGNDEAQQSGKRYMRSLNTQFLKAGTRGLSILVASGDMGVCGRSGCRPFGWSDRFNPDFPASSPYVTAVGGTDFVGASIGDESAWKKSGGGTSDTFSIPAYQAQAVAAFKNASAARGLLPPQKWWSANGRGYPDVSALAGQKAMYCVALPPLLGNTPKFGGVFGTSAATPVVAAIVARLNALRLAKPGGKPLGFLNPLFYQHPQAFHDVTTGCNKGTFFHGFTAIEGWDAASGLGTPNYEALAQIV